MARQQKNCNYFLHTYMFILNSTALYLNIFCKFLSNERFLDEPSGIADYFDKLRGVEHF